MGTIVMVVVIGAAVAYAVWSTRKSFVIRAERGGVRVVEIPIRVLEKRQPSIHLFRRVPNVLKNLTKLFVAIRIKG